MSKLYTFNRFPAKQLPENLLLILLVSTAFAMAPVILCVLAYMLYVYFTQPVDTQLYMLWLKVLGLLIVYIFLNALSVWFLCALGRWVLTLFIPNRDRIDPITIFEDLRAFFRPGPGGIRRAARHRFPPNFLRILFANLLTGQLLIALPILLFMRYKGGVFKQHDFIVGIIVLLVSTFSVALTASIIIGIGNSIGRWFFGSNEGSPGDYMVSYNMDDIENIR